MSGYYKAEVVHDAAVKLGYDGHWDGSLSSALHALETVIGEDGGRKMTDAQALEPIVGAANAAEDASEPAPTEE